MGKDSMRITTKTSTATAKTVQFDREVEQTIVSLKKGAQLLKYGRRGKPKFCPFRLSTDEKHLLWYSGKEERYLSLDSVTKIILGQGTVNFQRQPQPEKECQSFSLIYADGERSLDLICKDKEQAESWCVGLRALITRSHHSRPLGALRSHRGAQSCINSPVGYTRRKLNLGIMEDPTKNSQVRSLCGSPTRSLAERCLSDGLTYSSNNFCSSEPRAFSRISTKTVMADYVIEKKRETSLSTEYQSLPSAVTSPQGFSPVEGTDVLKDVLIWGEGTEGGHLGGVVGQTCIPNSMKSDSLLPKLLESTATLDIKSISFGGKHAALVTRQGEVFCWGHEKGGRLGHKTNMDVSYPKIVESLNGVDVESVACGEYHTCALTLSGELYTWGDSGVGVGLVDNGSNRSKWLPQKISGPLDGIYVSNVTCGEWHTAVVSSAGQLFTYGDGTFGVLGHGNLQSVSQPKEVESLKGLRVKSVACGPWHMAAVVDIMADHLKANAPGGKLFTWGDGDKGRLGHLDQERKLLPTCVASLVDHDFVQVSCGRMMTVGLTITGTVCTMGSAAHGQLGNPQVEDKSIAIVGGKLKGEFVKDISSGSYHIAVLTSKGKVYTWGKGANGRLGLGDTEDRNSPTLVEALRERKVESVTCGSGFTAAICLHKSIFCSDQSTCSGCRMVFGFTRKKHNCYNCGFLFCRLCSSKKVINASLAPNKNKQHRVCDSCYDKLTKSANLDRVVQHEKDRGEATSTQAVTPKVSGNREMKFIEGQTFGKQGINQQLLDPVMPLSSGLPRWGQVPCPLLFSTSERDCSSMSNDLSKYEPSALSPAYAHIIPPTSNYLIPPAMNSGKDITESGRMITEVQRLRAEAKSLEKKCQVKGNIIQEYQQRVDETWSLAKDEAAKCKAAKDIIKVLSAKLYTMSEKQCAGREANVISVLAEGVHLYLPQLRPICTDKSASEDVEPTLTSSQLSPIVGLPKERLLDDLCDSPIQFRNTLSSTYERAKPDDGGRSADTQTDSKQNVTKTSKSEWVEQDEPGVYITFVNLPSGHKGLKRVRFSRRRFSEKEAERWWEENQLRIYQKYEIEEVISPKRNKMKS